MKRKEWKSSELFCWDSQCGIGVTTDMELKKVPAVFCEVDASSYDCTLTRGHHQWIWSNTMCVWGDQSQATALYSLLRHLSSLILIDCCFFCEVKMIKEMTFLGELVLKNVPNIFTIQWESNLVWIRREISNQAMFPTKNKYMWVLMWEDNKGYTSSPEKIKLLIMDYFGHKHAAFLHHKMLIYGLS